ncbi:hypothetical protein CLV63_11635 [Murinocardiopsis flavida]|uniref:Uncharacterized protein n=1 Tax=Murinocardiopsis flavida TaxID=645275 RepID=A0A2P8D8S2_9ACTN|nr:hypothetical protein [Murinocardiopsis flavida]PSK93628.1 hypothetical protein CLV63_11635 [Murinocardiopsis flavida]
MPGAHQSPRDPAAPRRRRPVLGAPIARPTSGEPDADSGGCWPPPAPWPAPGGWLESGLLDRLRPPSR